MQQTALTEQHNKTVTIKPIETRACLAHINTNEHSKIIMLTTLRQTTLNHR